MPIIRLSDADLGLIIEYPSGVKYSNQTCGVCCMQPELEGVFVPLDGESACERLEAHFEGPKYSGTGAMLGLDEMDAELIDGELREIAFGDCLRVDRARLRESHEAWVHVVLDGSNEELSLFAGFGPYPRRGVITWPNSD